MKGPYGEADNNTMLMMSVTRFENDKGYSLVQGEKT